MDSSILEYISSIEFSNYDDIEPWIRGQSKCIVTTNCGRYFITIDLDRSEFSHSNMFLVNDQIDYIHENHFSGAQLFKIFRKRWGANAKIMEKLVENNLMFVKFETSKGNFCVVAISDSKDYYTSMNLHFENSMDQDMSIEFK